MQMAVCFSPTVIVNNSCMTASVTIFPNPSTEQQGIGIRVSSLDKVDYQVFDQTGKLIRNGQFAGLTTIKGLKAGVYFVKATSATINVTQKIIVR